MSLTWNLEYTSKLPEGVSRETKDKALVEIIVYHVKSTEKMDEMMSTKGYKSYSPMLERVIKGETSFKQELKSFEKEYGPPKEVMGGKIKILDGSGWSKFLFEPGIIAIFGSGTFDFEEDIEMLDSQIERLRPNLIEKLYS